MLNVIIIISTDWYRLGVSINNTMVEGGVGIKDFVTTVQEP